MMFLVPKKTAGRLNPWRPVVCEGKRTGPWQLQSLILGPLASLTEILMCCFAGSHLLHSQLSCPLALAHH
jgi:hypothetical protein